MSQKIFIQPSEVWGYYKANTKNVQNTMREIASYEEYGISIYLSEDEIKCPNIVVEADDNEVYAEEVVNAANCEATVQRIYNDYLTDKVVEILQDLYDESDESKLDYEDAISERETELDILVYEFVAGVLGDEAACFDRLDGILDDLKEHFLEYMARKHDLPIFRPMTLEGEDGKEFYEEYPYTCMEFEDETNPIYMN